MYKNQKNLQYLIYTPDYPPVVGGAEIFIGQYAEFLRDKFSGVTIITRYPTKASRILNNIDRQPIYIKSGNLEIYRAPYLEIKYLRVLSSVFVTYIFFLFVLFKNKYHFIHFIGFYPSAIIWYLTRHLIKKSNIIYTEQGMLIDIIRKNKNIYSISPNSLQKCFKKFFKSCTKITCVSEAIKSRFLEIDNSLNIKIIPNGTDIHKSSNSLKKEIRIISTSRLVQKNNIQSLVKSMPMVISKYNGKKKIVLDIVGDGEERNSIIDLIKEHGLEDVVVMHGTLSSERVKNLYQASTLFCRLSLSEGFGISFIEAMSWGLPIIGSQIIGEMSYFSNDFGIAIKNIDDIAEVSDAILHYINDEDLLASSSISAIESSQKFDWKIINQSYLNYISLPSNENSC